MGAGSSVGTCTRAHLAGPAFSPVRIARGPDSESRLGNWACPLRPRHDPTPTVGGQWRAAWHLTRHHPGGTGLERPSLPAHSARLKRHSIGHTQSNGRPRPMSRHPGLHPPRGRSHQCLSRSPPRLPDSRLSPRARGANRLGIVADERLKAMAQGGQEPGARMKLGQVSLEFAGFT